MKHPDVPMGDALLATQEAPRVDLPKESLESTLSETREALSK